MTTRLTLDAAFAEIGQRGPHFCVGCNRVGDWHFCRFIPWIQGNHETPTVIGLMAVFLCGACQERDISVAEATAALARVPSDILPR